MLKLEIPAGILEMGLKTLNAKLESDRELSLKAIDMVDRHLTKIEDVIILAVKDDLESAKMRRAQRAADDHEKHVVEVKRANLRLADEAEQAEVDQLARAVKRAELESKLSELETPKSKK